MAKFKVDKSARYAKTHEWVRMEDGIATVGISDYAQDALSDVVFVDLPEVGELVTAGKWPPPSNPSRPPKTSSPPSAAR